MNKLYEIINQILKENDLDTFDKFEDSHHLKNDLGLDSFNLAELTVLIEDEYDIDIFECTKRNVLKSKKVCSYKR